MYQSMTSNVTEHNQPDEIPESIRVRRASERASYEPEVVNSIIDAGLIAHVGTVRDGLPVVIPMFCVRDDDSLLLHGPPAAGVIRRAKQGFDVCVTMSLLDGLVLARSSFHHSVNFRSVVVIGEAIAITDQAEKEHALEQFIERLVPGRQAQLRPTNTKEFRATEVLRVSLAQASTKIRTGQPIDDEEDYAHDVWAGVLPLAATYGAPEADPRLMPDIEVPDNISSMVGKSL